MTQFVALFCASEELSPGFSLLWRTLHRIVDYSVRPQCLDIRDGRVTNALTLKDRLFPAQLNQLIVYSTQFCCKGRLLTVAELAHAYGLPVMIRLGGLDLLDLTI
jgi:hypothetical protein